LFKAASDEFAIAIGITTNPTSLGPPQQTIGQGGSFVGGGQQWLR
jgi:hypothetical protein